MANWVKSSAHKSHGSSSYAKSSSQSDDSFVSRTHSRDNLKRRLVSVLDKFNSKASLSKIHDTATKIVDLVEKHCRYKSHNSQSQQATETSKSKSMKASKSHHASESSGIKSSSKVASAAKSVTTSKSFKETPNSSTVTTFSSTTKLSNAEKSFSSTKLMNIKKSKPDARTTQKALAKKSKRSDELEKELKRLADSDGFVSKYPTGYKRVPKPVERFSIGIYDEQSRRSARLRRRKGENMDLIEEIPKKKAKLADNQMVSQVQQHQVFSQTTSTTGKCHDKSHFKWQFYLFSFDEFLFHYLQSHKLPMLAI